MSDISIYHICLWLRIDKAATNSREIYISGALRWVFIFFFFALFISQGILFSNKTVRRYVLSLIRYTKYHIEMKNELILIEYLNKNIH